MPAAAANAFLFGDVSRTGQLAQGDLRTLRTVADWIRTFVTRPERGLGCARPVYPFVPVALERKTLRPLLPTVAT